MNAARGVRTRLLLVVLTAITVALAVATVGFNLLLVRSTDGSSRAVLRQRVDSEQSLVRIVGGRITVTETSNDPIGDSRIWIYDAQGRAIESPRSGARTTAAARSLVTGPQRFLTVERTDERLYSLPIVGPDGRRYGTIVAGVSLAPYEQTRRSALLTSLLFAATVLLIAGAAAGWLLRSALRPVSVMTEQAEAWSEHDLDRRFGLGDPHDELTRLGFTLDLLLDRIAASLRHERRFSAELSHELRTPLAKLIAEGELALRRERAPDEYRAALGVVLQNAQQITRIVETLVAAARYEAGAPGTSNATDVAYAVADACADTAAARGVTVDVTAPPSPLVVGVDGDLAERILQPVVDNACRYGRSRVRVEITREEAQTVFVVVDDGPGLEADERESIFDPAVRGSAGRLAGDGAGLGLSLARRLARAASGDVEAGAAGSFVVRLPAV